MVVNKQNQSAHVQIPLLFPLTRTNQLTKQRTNTLTMIYKSVDRLKRINEPVYLNVTTTLVLPVKAILQPSVTVSKMSIKTTQLKVKDLYQPNPGQPLQLEARKALAIPVDIRLAYKKIVKEINENKVRIQPFFHLLLQPPQDDTNPTTNINFQPFIDSLYDFNKNIPNSMHRDLHLKHRQAQLEFLLVSIPEPCTLQCHLLLHHPHHPNQKTPAALLWNSSISFKSGLLLAGHLFI
ncbi:hypothetical protein MAM1_0299c09407 [Mucor ambiguus]|uniref:Uncharacterized protein n=1 Tax=Mucor ambiguus TaxID=91626 RepID=A0A0C9MQZ3_9FUNG|nr:hypothetical protein MAM1_0299c09407 [Mucor ambiguus]